MSSAEDYSAGQSHLVSSALQNDPQLVDVKDAVSQRQQVAKHIELRCHLAGFSDSVGKRSDFGFIGDCPSNIAIQARHQCARFFGMDASDDCL